jgi:hypothetical protein
LRLAAEWAQYREQVVAPDAGPVQVTETRMAFYAGAAVMYAAVLEATALPEDEAVEALEVIHGDVVAANLEALGE